MSSEMVAEYEVSHSKAKAFYERYERKEELQHQTHFCPGCGHGQAHKMLAKAIDELGIQDRTILVGPVGCGVFTYNYFDVGNISAAHGRATAVATGVKRSRPESIVIDYQGDGDLAAIGSAEILHAANRGEPITVIFINNAIYSMTGGQSAPTTLLGQKSATSPNGRSAANEGYPLHVCELLATLEAPVYIERVGLGDAKQIMQAARAIKKAMENQVRGLGFSLIEVLSPCPTLFKMTPVQAQQWVREVMEKTFPLGVFRDRTQEAQPRRCPRPLPRSTSFRIFLAWPTRICPRAIRWRSTSARSGLARARGGLRRAGRPAAGRGAGRGRTRCRPGGFLAALLWAGDALRHLQLPCAHHPASHRFADGDQSQRAGGDE